MAGRRTVLRKCAACGEKKDRRELIRLVRTPLGEVIIDRTDKANGRGAYLCADAGCLSRAKKSRALEKSLGVKISDQIYTSLEEEIASDEQQK